MSKIRIIAIKDDRGRDVVKSVGDAVSKYGVSLKAECIAKFLEQYTNPQLVKTIVRTHGDERLHQIFQRMCDVWGFSMSVYEAEVGGVLEAVSETTAQSNAVRQIYREPPDNAAWCVILDASGNPIGTGLDATKYTPDAGSFESPDEVRRANARRMALENAVRTVSSAYFFDVLTRHEKQRLVEEMPNAFGWKIVVRGTHVPESEGNIDE
jgi:hypothetical protein